MLTVALGASRVVLRISRSCFFCWSKTQAGDQALSLGSRQLVLLQRSFWFWISSGRDKHDSGLKQPLYPLKAHSYRLGDSNVTDEYWWLSDYTQAKPYLVQEQQYYKQSSKLWSRHAQQLLQEMKQHIDAVKHVDPPEAVGQFEYWTEDNHHGHDSMKRRCLSTNQEEVLLSEAVLRSEAAQLSKTLGMPVAGDWVNTVKLSQDQRLLAYAVSLTQGVEQYCCVARDLTTGAVMAAGVVPHATSFEWSADSSCLYYCLGDDSGRPSKVYRRHLCTPAPCGDELLFSETDPKHFVTLTRTKDWCYVLINSHSKLSSEVRLLDAYDSHSRPVCIQARSPGLEYFVEHVGGHLLLLTNMPSMSTCTTSTSDSTTASRPYSVISSARPTSTKAPSAAGSSAVGGNDGDYTLMTLPVAALKAGQSSADHWRVLMAERDDVAIVDMDVFSSCVVLHELNASRPALTLLRLAAAQQQEDCQMSYLRLVQQQQVSLPEWVLSLRPGINQDYRATHMRVYASSPVVPEVAFNLDLHMGQILQQGQLQQQQQQQHCCQRLWASAADGVQVPVTLLHRRELPYNGVQPLLVEVYGAYGQVLEADYKAYRLPLLQRGWSVALVHIRGGGELGRRWHAAGRQLQKPNSVSDLLAALQLLVDMGVTAPGKIAAYAASAGGLTLAAAVNTSPHWFAAVILEAPFVDWAGAMSDTAAGDMLAEHETDEWGDPRQNPRVAEMIYNMCPYTNLVRLTRSQVYPAMLVTAGLLDNRVPFYMPAKFVAKVRRLAQQQGEQSRLVLLRFDEAAGHFSRGQSGGDLEDIAWQYAFLLSNLDCQSRRSFEDANSVCW